jgi:hypothetical protein
VRWAENFDLRQSDGRPQDSVFGTLGVLVDLAFAVGGPVNPRARGRAEGAPVRRHIDDADSRRR